LTETSLCGAYLYILDKASLSRRITELGGGEFDIIN
jgi:hypothetical protein